MAEKNTILTDFKLGTRVYFLDNNVVCSSLVEEIFIESTKSGEEIKNDIKYKILLNGETVLMDQEKLFSSAQYLKIYTTDTKRLGGQGGHYVTPNLQFGSKVYLMDDNKICMGSIEKMETVITSIISSTSVAYTVVYVIKLLSPTTKKDEIIKASFEDVYGSKEELIKATFG